MTNNKPISNFSAKPYCRKPGRQEKLNSSGASARSKKEKELPPITEDEIPFELPEGWVWCRLGDYYKYGNSGIETKNLVEDNMAFRIRRHVNLFHQRIIQKIRFKERKSLSSKNVIKKGDVLYSKLRPYLDKVVLLMKMAFVHLKFYPFNFIKELMLSTCDFD